MAAIRLNYTKFKDFRMSFNRATGGQYEDLVSIVGFVGLWNAITHFVITLKRVNSDESPATWAVPIEELEESEAIYEDEICYCFEYLGNDSWLISAVQEELAALISRVS